jgi:lipoxygenase/linoleate 9S-lipoxygenase
MLAAQASLAGRLVCSIKQTHVSPLPSPPPRDAKGNDTALIPIALELAAHPNCRKPRKPTPTSAPTAGTVYSRSKLLASNEKNVWTVAKLAFRSLDVGFHQLISHW